MRARDRRRSSGLPTPPAHLLGPGETLPTGRKAFDAFYEWLRREGLLWNAAGPIPTGYIDPLALLVVASDPRPVTWHEFVVGIT